jgi:hypothetical protein
MTALPPNAINAWVRGIAAPEAAYKMGRGIKNPRDEVAEFVRSEVELGFV